MKSGIQFNQGEILIVPFPFSDLNGIKQRPVLVLSKTKYNFDCSDIVTCGITSNLNDSSFSVLIDNKDLIKGQIPKVSRIKVDKLFTLEKSLIRKRVGMINKETMDKVKQEFLKII
jgi:mRNA interferase MazF